MTPNIKSSEARCRCRGQGVIQATSDFSSSWSLCPCQKSEARMRTVAEIMIEKALGLSMFSPHQREAVARLLFDEVVEDRGSGAF